jgi:hypothetical protein
MLPVLVVWGLLAIPGAPVSAEAVVPELLNS